MLAFQWREFSPPLSFAHRLLQCYHSQWEIGDAAINGEYPLSPPPQLGSLANERAVSSDVTLWRCTFWSGKFASVSSNFIVKPCSLSSSIMIPGLWDWLLNQRLLHFLQEGWCLQYNEGTEKSLWPLGVSGLLVPLCMKKGVVLWPRRSARELTGPRGHGPLAV